MGVDVLITGVDCSTTSVDLNIYLLIWLKSHSAPNISILIKQSVHDTFGNSWISKSHTH